jgi:hypothetical protein
MQVAGTRPEQDARVVGQLAGGWIVREWHGWIFAALAQAVNWPAGALIRGLSSLLRGQRPVESVGLVGSVAERFSAGCATTAQGVWLPDRDRQGIALVIVEGDFAIDTKGPVFPDRDSRFTHNPILSHDV